MGATARQIGNATLYLGDCRAVLPTLATESVNMIWTDPPYGNDNHSGDFNARLNEHRNIASQPILNDDLDSMRTVVDAMLVEGARIVTKVGSLAVCVGGGGGGPRPTFAWLASRVDEKGLAFFHQVVWDKKNPGIGWRYRRQHELIMICHRADGSLAWADDNIQVPNIIPLMPPRERQHPNEKPLGLVEGFIAWHTKPGDVVCDPFCGSATTGVAALKLNRKFIGIELDPVHFETACQRITEASKQDGFF